MKKYILKMLIKKKMYLISFYVEKWVKQVLKIVTI